MPTHCRAQRTAHLAWLTVAALAVGLPAPARAQQDGEQPTMQELLDRLAEVEAWMDASAAGEDEDLGLGLTVGTRDLGGTIQIFGSTEFGYEDPVASNRGHAGFAIGSVDFVTSLRFGDHWRTFSETVIDGGSNDSISFSQERLWASWIASDALYVKMGTEHSPISRWNQLYHHGHWLEPTIQRPMMVAFEGGQGILPMHRTGITVGGARNLEAGRLEYFTSVANGRGETPRDKQRTEDADDQKSVDAGLAFEPAGGGLRFGVAMVYDTIPVDPASADPLRSRPMREWITTAHVAWDPGPVDVLAEYACINHEARFDGSEYDSDAGYVQLSVPMGTWTPYTRFDYRDMAEGDPFYGDMMLGRNFDRWSQSVGVRWDTHENVAVKTEVSYGQDDMDDGMGGIATENVWWAGVQVSWWL